MYKKRHLLYILLYVYIGQYIYICIYIYKTLGNNYLEPLKHRYEMNKTLFHRS